MEQDNSIRKMMKIINSMFETEINKELVNLNITHTQLEILIFIKKQMDEDIEVNQIDIEKTFNLKNPTVTGILNRLEEKNYIKRTNSIKNARYKRIVITQAQDEILEKGRIQAELIENKIISNLTKDEQELFRKLLNKIIE